MHAARIDDLPRTPATHLRLYLYAAAIESITHTAHQSGSMEEVLERFPFIARYVSELADRGLDGGTLEQAPAWWREAIEAWESCARDRLPLRELCRAARLDYESIVLLVGFGLCDEDTRFEALFDAARRPTPRVVVEWFAHLEAGE